MKTPHVELKETERSSLESMVSKGKVPVRVLKRALALLALDQGESLQSVAAHQQLSYATVSNLRDNYKRNGLPCLYDQPRSGRPAKIDGVQRAQITALACSKAPVGHERWTLRLLADKIVELEFCESISHTQVATILKKTK
jgi:putative transposase